MTKMRKSGKIRGMVIHSSDVHRPGALYAMPYTATVIGGPRATTVVLIAADANGHADDITALELSNS